MALLPPTPANSNVVQVTSWVVASTLQLIVPVCRCVPVGAAAGLMEVVIAACAVVDETKNASSADARMNRIRFMDLCLPMSRDRGCRASARRESGGPPGDARMSSERAGPSWTHAREERTELRFSNPEPFTHVV